ncbi:MAG: beta-ketoacyl-[acyl-carrier-protein] synthase family protein, partial [Saprospiraceae bacterium]|nr:beta-ketoacyl-[acyl-carrier-protein] synthase family protein [Saprospiraceae bacterium]
MAADAIWITGAGLISAIGADVGEALEALAAGRSGVRTLQHLPSVHRGVLPVGEVDQSNEALAVVAGLSPTLPRSALLSLIAAREALQSAGAWPLPAGLRTGFVSATTVGGMDKTTEFYRDFMQNPARGRLRDVVHHECGSLTDLVAEALGLHEGFVSTVSTACSSSANS